MARPLAAALILGACTVGNAVQAPSSPTPSPTPAPTAEPTPFPWVLITEGTPTDVADAVAGWSADMGIDARVLPVPAGSESPPGLAAAVGPEVDLASVAPAWSEAGVLLVVLDPEAIVPGPATSTVGPDWDADQAGFLAGLAAGYATSTEGVGLGPGLGGEFARGVDEGIRYACPRCRREPIGDPASAPFGIDVVVLSPDFETLDGLPLVTEAWTVAAMEAATSARLAARVVTDPVPLTLAALEALMGGEPGAAWTFGAENGGLRIADVDGEAISPGRERLLRDAEVNLRLGTLAVGGGG